MNTPKACPGWQNFKNLSSFECKCPECGKIKEIFSDEFEKEHYCRACDQKIDFTRCTFSGSAKSV